MLLGLVPYILGYNVYNIIIIMHIVRTCMYMYIYYMHQLAFQNPPPPTSSASPLMTLLYAVYYFPTPMASGDSGPPST